MSHHQDEQKNVIALIEAQIAQGSLTFSTIDPVEDYDHDSRLSLSGVHIPAHTLKEKIWKDVLDPLRALQPEHFYYPKESLHMTIKSVRTVNDPPRFDEAVAQQAERVFADVVSAHHRFNVSFYRLLLFPTNLALVGTTDEELDNIILDLDERLREAGIPDDKRYINDRYFFCSMTLARFTRPLSNTFRKKVAELSSSLALEPYTIDSVTLLTASSVFRNRRVVGEWELR